MPEGLDEIHARRPLPLASACADDTLVAFGSRRSRTGAIYLKRYWHEREFDAIEEIAKLGDC